LPRHFVILGSLIMLAAAGLAAPARPTAGASLVFQTNMFGQNMVPPVNTGVWGFVRFFFNDARTEADYTLDVKGVSSNQVGTVDMFRGAPGTNGTLVRHLSDGGFLTFGGHLKLSAQEIADFVGGNYYVVLTTSAHPQGEIRGQIYVPCGFAGSPPPGCSDPDFAGVPAPAGPHDLNLGGISRVLDGTPPPPNEPTAMPAPPAVEPPPGGVTARPGQTGGSGILPPNTGDGGLRSR
jgi:hypothetical protein